MILLKEFGLAFECKQLCSESNGEFFVFAFLASKKNHFA